MGFLTFSYRSYSSEHVLRDAGYFKMLGLENLSFMG
jgi:hypothetical protein